MAEVSLPKPKPYIDELTRPVGVMPNWAYGKTQFNDLDIYKKIEPMLKADPVAMLGWQSYTTGNLEIRKVEAENRLNYPGLFASSRLQKKRNPVGRPSVNKELEEWEQVLGRKIPRKFKSSSDVDKMHYTDYPEGKLIGKEEESLIHELRHAGLEFLTKRTGEERKIKNFTVQAFNKYDTEGKSYNRGRTFPDEEGVFTSLDREMQKKFFPEAEYTVGKNRMKALDIYDEHKSARKEIDKRVAKLNALATQELKAIRNTSVSERLKQKSLKGDDKSTIKKIIEWMFSQKQPNNLDTQMNALKVG